MNLRKAAESSAASAEEKRSILEAKLSQLSETFEREKKCLRNELTQLKRDSKLSVSRISADVSSKCSFLFDSLVFWFILSSFNFFTSCSLKEWNAGLVMPSKNLSFWKSRCRILRSSLMRYLSILLASIRVRQQLAFFNFLVLSCDARFLFLFLCFLVLSASHLYFQCLHQKSEAEKKLSSFTFQEVTSTENSNILVRHLQEELRNYVSLSFHRWFKCGEGFYLSINW